MHHYLNDRAGSLDRGWSQVELRISDDHLASQRVAVKAGFRPAGRVRTEVPSVGREFDDRLYVMTAESLAHRQ